jgi:hypothetical protein
MVLGTNSVANIATNAPHTLISGSALSKKGREGYPTKYGNSELSSHRPRGSENLPSIVFGNMVLSTNSVANIGTNAPHTLISGIALSKKGCEGYPTKYSNSELSSHRPRGSENLPSIVFGNMVLGTNSVANIGTNAPHTLISGSALSKKGCEGYPTKYGNSELSSHRPRGSENLPSIVFGNMVLGTNSVANIATNAPHTLISGSALSKKGCKGYPRKYGNSKLSSCHPRGSENLPSIVLSNMVLSTNSVANIVTNAPHTLISGSTLSKKGCEGYLRKYGNSKPSSRRPRGSENLPSIVFGVQQEVRADDSDAHGDYHENDEHQQHKAIYIVDFVRPKRREDEIPARSTHCTIQSQTFILCRK